jgi:hypothetical protein
VDELTTGSTTFYLCGAVPHVRLQLALGDDRAEVSLDNLERLEHRPQCEEPGVVLRALTVVAATRILGWKMTNGIPTPAAGCGGIGVDGRCQLVVATVVHVAKAVEMSVLRLDQPEPRVPKRMSPVQGLEQRRVDLTRAVHSDRRLLTKTLDSAHVTANKPGTRCSAEHTHYLSRRRTFRSPRRSRARRSAPDTEGTGLEPEPLATRSSPFLRAYLPARFYPRHNDQIEELIAKEAQATGRSNFAAISSSAPRSAGWRSPVLPVDVGDPSHEIEHEPLVVLQAPPACGVH